jgi:hypothetical protein
MKKKVFKKLILSVLRVEQKNTGLKVEREISRKKMKKMALRF